MKTLLVLEDNIAAALEIELILDGIEGFDCKVAGGIAKANQIYADTPPDIIIADIQLNDGENALDWLQSKAQHIPTIIVSGHSSDEYYQRALKLDAQAYMIKPVDKVSLKFELQRILNTPSSAQSEVACVSIKDGSKVHIIPEDQIISIVTEGNYSTILTSDKKLVIKTSLLRILKLLDTDRFIRVHRTSIVAYNKINEISYKSDYIRLINNSIIPLGKTYKHTLKEKLKGLTQI